MKSETKVKGKNKLCRWLKKRMTKKRHPSTLSIMKHLYPNRRMTLAELHLSPEDLLALKQDIKLFGGINVTYCRGNEIECIWLSSNGRKYIEQSNLQRNVIIYLKKNYKWIIGTIITIIGLLFFGACSNSKEIKRLQTLLDNQRKSTKVVVELDVTQDEFIKMGLKDKVIQILNK